MKLSEIIAANQRWFSARDFSGDLRYWSFVGASGKTYLVRLTYTYRINPVSNDKEIEPLLDEVFTSYESAKAWIKERG